MQRLLIRCGKLITMVPERPIIEDGAVVIEGDRIVSVDLYENLAHLADGAIVLGRSDQWVMPGFVNAHHHAGAAGGSFRKGFTDSRLERQLLSGHSSVMFKGCQRFAYLNTLWLTAELLRSGVTCTTDFYYGAEVRPYLGCEQGLNAYQKSGMRVAFIPVARECGSYVHGDDKVFLETLPPQLATEAVKRGIGRQANVSMEIYRECWKRIYEDFDGHDGRIKIFLGPDGPQWVTERGLGIIKGLAQAHGTGIQIHLLETRYERLYGPKVLGRSVCEYLEQINFLGPEVTAAHSVWLDDHDMEIYARNGVSAIHNPVSNLRLSSGISPVAEMLDKGVNVALGTDSYGMNDDNDFICDMRLAALLSRTPGLMSSGLSSPQLLRMATVNGAKALLMNNVGAIKPGMKADLIIVDTGRMTSPCIHPETSVQDILIHRALGCDVNTVLINGKIVMDNREIKTFNVDAIKDEIREEAARIWETTRSLEDAQQAVVRQIEPYVLSYFIKWDEHPLPARYRYNTKVGDES